MPSRPVAMVSGQQLRRKATDLSLGRIDSRFEVNPQNVHIIAISTERGEGEGEGGEREGE
jgi:hypothetical protein